MSAGAWIQVYGGAKVYPFALAPHDLDIDVIAHSLSQQCRYAGHTRWFYSVAQHSVLVSRLCPPDLALAGLLHDAAEAYLQDMVKPIKDLPCMMDYRVAERIANASIEKRWEVDIHAEAVCRADRVAMATEVRDLMQPVQPAWREWLTEQPDRSPIECEYHTTSEAAFLNRFKMLTGGGW